MKEETDLNTEKWKCCNEKWYSVFSATWTCLIALLLIIALSSNNWRYSTTTGDGSIHAYKTIYGLNGMSIMSDSVDGIQTLTYDTEKTYTINGVTASCTGTYESLFITFKCGSGYSYSYDECTCGTFLRFKSFGTVVKTLLSIAIAILFIFCYYQFMAFNTAFSERNAWLKLLAGIFLPIGLGMSITGTVLGNTLLPFDINCSHIYNDDMFDTETRCYAGPALNLSISATVFTAVGVVSYYVSLCCMGCQNQKTAIPTHVSGNSMAFNSNVSSNIALTRVVRSAQSKAHVNYPLPIAANPQFSQTAYNMPSQYPQPFNSSQNEPVVAMATVYTAPPPSQSVSSMSIDISKFTVEEVCGFVRTMAHGRFADFVPNFESNYIHGGVLQIAYRDDNFDTLLSEIGISSSLQRMQIRAEFLRFLSSGGEAADLFTPPAPSYDESISKGSYEQELE